MEEQQNGRVGRMVLASLIAGFGPLSFGFALGYPSSALLDFTNESDSAVRLTKSEGSWFAVSYPQMYFL